jgi:hypothetical protein
MHALIHFSIAQTTEEFPQPKEVPFILSSNDSLQFEKVSPNDPYTPPSLQGVAVAWKEH